jgi:uncharacterized protein YbjT (DUF2867 family)
MARALIVGCGCRGRLLARALVERGWVVRGTSRRAEAAGEIEAAGAEFALADPNRVDTVLDHIGDVAVVAWLLGSAEGNAEAVDVLHGRRLQLLLEELVDTPVRGIAYEAAGTVSPTALAEGSRIVGAASERWRIPAELIEAQPADHEEWAAAALGAVERLVGAS